MEFERNMRREGNQIRAERNMMGSNKTNAIRRGLRKLEGVMNEATFTAHPVEKVRWVWHYTRS